MALGQGGIRDREPSENGTRGIGRRDSLGDTGWFLRGVVMQEHTAIENPNSSGQGYCAAHVNNPHHATITKYGWVYSHTTPIRAVDGSIYTIHTYKHKHVDWNISVNCRPGWRVDSSRGGSGRMTSYFGSQLDKYLKRKSRELEV